MVGGRALGRRALVIGAVGGMLPDLDVLVPYEDAVDNFTFHRSWSHSYFVLSAVAVILTVAARSWSQRYGMTLRRTFLMVWLVLVTHPLLDSFTVYGTQVLWPLSDFPVAWGTIFIIDPLFTVPMLIAIVLVLLKERKGNQSVKDASHRRSCLTIMRAGLSLSVFYLFITVALFFHVTNSVRPAFADEGIDRDHYLVLPTPGSVLWRVVGRHPDQYLEGFHSLLKPERELQFTYFDTNDELLQPLIGFQPVERLKWFTRGFYTTDLEENTVVVSDLRMGIEAQYVFRFNVGRMDTKPGSVSTLSPTVLRRFQPNLDRMRWVLKQY
jgi:inner membrane protein